MISSSNPFLSDHFWAISGHTKNATLVVEQSVAFTPTSVTKWIDSILTSRSCILGTTFYLYPKPYTCPCCSFIDPFSSQQLQHHIHSFTKFEMSRFIITTLSVFFQPTEPIQYLHRIPSEKPDNRHFFFVLNKT